MMLDSLASQGFEIMTLQHAKGILEYEFPDALEELEQVLAPTSIPIQELVFGGGGKTAVVKRLEDRFYGLGWNKHNFNLKKLVDGVETQAMSHEIDHVKKFESGTVALEIEWNNKDPFFDRDLQNFRNLHADGAISVGIIVTRGSSLQYGFKEKMIAFAQSNGINNLEALAQYYNPTKSQKESILKKVETGVSFEEAWADRFVSSKFGQSTTHWDKLIDRVNRGVGNPCPLVLIGIPLNVVM
jgi:hypothetical protein